MRGAARALMWPGLATGLAFGLLVSLGVWQVRRLGEKEALIERVESRAHAAPAALPPQGAWSALAPADYDFRRAVAEGHFPGGRDALIFAHPPEGAGREPGYMVVSPFALDLGGVVLIERGFVPASRADDAAGRQPPTGHMAITGVMRAPQTRNFFTPPDAPDRMIWYTRDPLALATALGVAGAPFTLALERPSTEGPNGFPRLVSATPEFVNNHLSYAFTWFSLAAALLVVFGLYARTRLKRDV